MRREYSVDEPELMDLPGQDPAELRRDLERIAQMNRTYGARRVVARLFARLAAGRRGLTLVDLAAGYGDHARHAIEEAHRRGQRVTAIAVDFNFESLRIARSVTPKKMPLHFVQADARRLPFRDGGADLVFCTLALHHFSEEEAVGVLREMNRVARAATACVDLARSRLGAWAIWLMTAVLEREPMVRHDGRLSARRAFSVAEMKALAQRAGWSGRRHFWFFWFQQAVTGEKRAGA